MLNFELRIRRVVNYPVISRKIQIDTKIMKFSLASSIICIVIMLYSSSKITASVISCPPNSFQQEMYPKINQLCGVIQQALSDMAPQNDGYLPGLVNDRNNKRQDVDHVFLRFGKRFGL